MEHFSPRLPKFFQFLHPISFGDEREASSGKTSVAPYRDEKSIHTSEDYDELNKRLFTSLAVNIICFQLFSSSKNIYDELGLGVPLRDVMTRDF